MPTIWGPFLAVSAGFLWWYGKGSGCIALSFIVALFLTVIPLPEWVQPFRPLWVAMVLIYWCMALPARVGVGGAWCLGLVLDGLQGMVFGVNACALTILAWVVLSSYQRLRSVPLAHQMLLVFLHLFFYGLLIWSLQRLFTGWMSAWQGWQMALSSTILWPWLFVVLRDLRRRYVT